MTNHFLGEPAQPEIIYLSTKATTWCLVIPVATHDCSLQFCHSSHSLFAFLVIFFIPDLFACCLLVCLYGYWKTQLIFTGELSSSSFSLHSCLSACSRLGISKPSFPAEHFSCSLRQFQFQGNENGCLSTSSPMPIPHQYLPVYLSFLSKASSILLPSPSSHNLTPVLLLPMYPLDLSLPFLAKGTKYFRVSLKIPEPDLYH